MSKTISIGLVGAGMFGSEVHLPTYAGLQRSGLAPWLGRLGLDPIGRDLAEVDVRLVALATRSRTSAEKKASEFRNEGLNFAMYHGDTPWIDMLKDFPDLDVLAVATPDHLHTAPILAALENGTHVITEKPMALDAFEADAIVDAAKAAGRMVAVDMHKRYDPDHLRIRDAIAHEIGAPLYGSAMLEEPLSISTEVFRDWAEKSDPFSYVGCHWTDLFIAYFGVIPLSLHAVGQKKKLIREFDLDTFDAVQVKVQFDNGMSIDFVNNWITPDAFEGSVNQESRLVGINGFVESDSQYRGLRYTTHEGTRTANTHFTRMVKREDGSKAFQGYGADSLVLSIAKVAEMKFLGKKLEDLEGAYPSARQGRISVLIVHAAREVVQRNWEYMELKKGAPVTAVFGEKGITIYDPYAGPSTIYNRPV